ncbi:MAG: Xaa-Pro peptidase family protein [Nitrospirae bacterium]|nr:Xaa-Pro peptidase family protein [Nitrospirota bacterium]MCL5423065.1 Xaa-Pro peptidase family protein [Nitrospirota bacterium]
MRLAGLRESFEKKRTQGFLVTTVANVRYLSGFTGSSGFVLITKNKNIFVTDFRYKEQAERELSVGGIEKRTEFPPPRGGIGWDIIIEKGDRLKIIKNLIANLGIRTLGFESAVAYEFFKGLSQCGAGLKPFRDAVERLREVKDREEIRSIREAVRRAEDAFRDVRPHIRQGRREREIALMLEERLKKRGCNRIPFDIIVASGDNAAMPHAGATSRKLSAGDLVVVDWGGEAGGYYSDMTRTFLIKGSGSSNGRGEDLTRKREIFRHVLDANRRAVSAVRAGAESRTVDSAARDVIKSAGYGEFFGHGTGHGVGLEVHELPRISWARSETLEESMVFTVEPGIYLPGLGGVRIEDMVLVKPDGPEVLTKLPRSLEII